MRLGKWGIACIIACMPFLFVTPQANAAELTDEEVAQFREFLAQKPVPEEKRHAEEHLPELRSFLDQFRGITFGGFIENFYQHESINPNAGNNIAITPKVFDRQENSFTVNNIEMWLYKEAPNPGDVGFKITLNWGDQASRITFVGPVHDQTPGVGDQETFSEGYVLWNLPIGKGVTLKFGKFATWVGYEVWEAHWNPNFSRSYIYGWLIPFTNTGVGLSYPVTDKFTADYYFTNTSDGFVNSNEGFTHGTQLNYAVGDLAFLKDINLHLDTLWGNEGGTADNEQWTSRYDFTVSFSPMDKWGLATNANWTHNSADTTLSDGATVKQTTNAWAVAQYVTYQHLDWLGFALRGEYFWNLDGQTGAIGTVNSNNIAGSLAEVTGTVNILLREKLWVRPEIRYDKIVHTTRRSADAWDNNTGHDANVTFAIAATYEW